jgi:hypothetical protein
MLALRSTLGEDALRTILWDSPCRLMGMARDAGDIGSTVR